MSRDVLQLILLRAAVPMVGFGFMDNFVLIIAVSLRDLSVRSCCVRLKLPLSSAGRLHRFHARRDIGHLHNVRCGTR